MNAPSIEAKHRAIDLRQSILVMTEAAISNDWKDVKDTAEYIILLAEALQKEERFAA